VSVGRLKRSPDFNADLFHLLCDSWNMHRRPSRWQRRSNAMTSDRPLLCRVELQHLTERTHSQKKIRCLLRYLPPRHTLMAGHRSYLPDRSHSEAIGQQRNRKHAPHCVTSWFVGWISDSEFRTPGASDNPWSPRSTNESDQGFSLAVLFCRLLYCRTGFVLQFLGDSSVAIGSVGLDCREKIRIQRLDGV